MVEGEMKHGCTTLSFKSGGFFVSGNIGAHNHRLGWIPDEAGDRPTVGLGIKNSGAQHKKGTAQQCQQKTT